MDVQEWLQSSSLTHNELWKKEQEVSEVAKKYRRVSKYSRKKFSWKGGRSDLYMQRDERKRKTKQEEEEEEKKGTLTVS